MPNTADLDHFDFLQLFRMLTESGKTGVLQILRDGEPFQGWLEGGRVRHLELGAVQGPEALLPLLQETKGRFQFIEGQRHFAPQLNTSLDEVVLLATAELPLLPAPFDGPARFASPERVEAFHWNAQEQRLLRRIEAQIPLADLMEEPGAPQLISQLARLGLLKPRKSRVARLTVGLTREVRGVALMDSHIFRRWKDDLLRHPQMLALRTEQGQTFTLPVREGPELGTALLFPADLLMQTGLRAGDSVLVQPV